jgi:alcohol dehydrogenase class IV
MASVAQNAIELSVQYSPRVVKDPKDMEAREAIGMATDLGGYAIMIGGTNGAHLTSFSLVDIAGHGTACGIMNPYYLVFFSPKIEKQLRLIGGIFKKYGYISENLGGLSGRDLGVAVARGMVAFGKAIGAPTALRDLPKFNDTYIAKALEAAKDPQLEMKLKNMPVPMTAALVEEYMGPILQAGADGDFSLIKLMAEK